MHLLLLMVGIKTTTVGVISRQFIEFHICKTVSIATAHAKGAMKKEGIGFVMVVDFLEGAGWFFGGQGTFITNLCTRRSVLFRYCCCGCFR